MDLRPGGRVALATGAPVGPGRRVARTLAEGGCRLAIPVRRLLLAAPAPTRDAVPGGFGRRDIRVSDAGRVQGVMPPFETGRGMAHAFLPAMRGRKSGRIVAITGTDEPPVGSAGVPEGLAVPEAFPCPPQARRITGRASRADGALRRSRP